jgi:hypothetical protein
MQPFQGIIRGRGRQPVTQLGSKLSGMTVELNTINWGISVRAEQKGRDIVMHVYLTGGSTGPRKEDLLTVVQNREVTL